MSGHPVRRTEQAPEDERLLLESSMTSSTHSCAPACPRPCTGARRCGRQARLGRGWRRDGPAGHAPIGWSGADGAGLGRHLGVGSPPRRGPAPRPIPESVWHRLPAGGRAGKLPVPQPLDGLLAGGAGPSPASARCAGGTEGQQGQRPGLGGSGRDGHAGVRLVAPGEGVERVGSGVRHDTYPAVLITGAEIKRFSKRTPNRKPGGTAPPGVSKRVQVSLPRALSCQPSTLSHQLSVVSSQSRASPPAAGLDAPVPFRIPRVHSTGGAHECQPCPRHVPISGFFSERLLVTGLTRLYRRASWWPAYHRPIGREGGGPEVRNAGGAEPDREGSEAP
jgi:hypothetical protein